MVMHKTNLSKFFIKYTRSCFILKLVHKFVYLWFVNSSNFKKPNKRYKFVTGVYIFSDKIILRILFSLTRKHCRYLLSAVSQTITLYCILLYTRL